MKVYYHINKNINCNWKIGDEIDLGKEHNPYWRSLAEMGDSIEINGEKFYVDLIARHAYDAYTGKISSTCENEGVSF